VYTVFTNVQYLEHSVALILTKPASCAAVMLRYFGGRMQALLLQQQLLRRMASPSYAVLDGDLGSMPADQAAAVEEQRHRAVSREQELTFLGTVTFRATLSINKKVRH
jgi:hypothetical protein